MEAATYPFGSILQHPHATERESARAERQNGCQQRDWPAVEMLARIIVRVERGERIFIEKIYPAIRYLEANS
jgi:hypothetical protein